VEILAIGDDGAVLIKTGGRQVYLGASLSDQIWVEIPETHTDRLRDEIGE
jgi:hypothetical protein